MQVRVPDDEGDRLREHPQQLPLARVELAAGLDDERAEVPSLRDQGEDGPFGRLASRRLSRVEEDLDALVASALLEMVGDRGERPVERGVDEHGRGDSPQDLALDGSERLLRGLAGRGREEGGRAHGRDHQVRHGPEGDEVRAAGRRPAMVEREVGPHARQPLVHRRHDHGRLEAEGIELGRPRQRPGEPRPAADGLPDTVQRRPPGGGHGVAHPRRQVGVHDRSRFRAQEGRRGGARHALGLVQHGAQEPGEVAFLRGIPPLREITHLSDQWRERASRPFGALPPPGEGPLCGLLELPRREWLHQVVHRAESHRPLDRVERRVGRDHHDLHAGIDRLDALEELDAVHPRHLHVHEDHVRAEPGQDRQHLLAAPGREDLVARLEDHADGLARALLVVHDQYARFGHAGAPPGFRLTDGFAAASGRSGSRPPGRRASRSRRGLRRSSGSRLGRRRAACPRRSRAG